MNHRKRKVPKADKSFKRVPDEVFDELRGRGQWIVYTMIGKLDVARHDGERPEWRVTLDGLIRELGWDLSPKTLKRDLEALHDAGWIGYEKPSGSRRTWTFWLERASVIVPPVSRQCPASVPPGETDTGTGDGAIPHEQMESDLFLAGHAGPLRTEN